MNARTISSRSVRNGTGVCLHPQDARLLMLAPLAPTGQSRNGARCRTAVLLRRPIPRRRLALALDAALIPMQTRRMKTVLLTGLAAVGTVAFGMFCLMAVSWLLNRHLPQCRCRHEQGPGKETK